MSHAPCAIIPPSTTRYSPVINNAFSLLKNDTENIITYSDDINSLGYGEPNEVIHYNQDTHVVNIANPSNGL